MKEHTMSTIPAIGFVVFYVSDMEQSVAYFTEKLGFKPIPGQSGPIFRGLAGSDENIGYGLNLVSEDTPPAGTVELYFKTDNLEELYNSFSAKNAGTTSIMQFPFGSVFNVKTPDKHALVMWQEPTK
jgi:catechol 2,3-dioxygenase-like lactoylglutathione lyase family enzyme